MVSSPRTVRTDTGELSSAATEVEAQSRELAALPPKLTCAGLSQMDFGEAHTAKGSAFINAFHRVGEILKGHSEALHGVSRNLSSTASRYDSAESANTGVVNQAGGR